MFSDNNGDRQVCSMVSIKTALLFFALVFCSLQGFGQMGDPPLLPVQSSLVGYTPLNIMDTKADPDVPGAITIDLANNSLLNAPDSMKLDWFGSWTVNIYYQYDFPVGSSKFSFHPGLGVGLEKYEFKYDVTLTLSPTDILTLITPLADVVPSASTYRKSTFSASYFDFPMEFRYYAKPNNKGLTFAAGGKIGFRFDSSTKIKYEEKGQTKKVKNKQNFNLNSPRFGVYGRFGTGAFSLYYYYSLSEMFRTNQGPDQAPIKTMMFGITFTGL